MANRGSNRGVGTNGANGSRNDLAYHEKIKHAEDQLLMKSNIVFARLSKVTETLFNSKVRLHSKDEAYTTLRPPARKPQNSPSPRFLSLVSIFLTLELPRKTLRSYRSLSPSLFFSLSFFPSFSLRLDEIDESSSLNSLSRSVFADWLAGTKKLLCLYDDYFGNSIYVVGGVTITGELLEHNLGWVAWKLHEAVVNHTEKVVRDWVDTWLQSLIVFQPARVFDPYSVMMGSSPRFNMYGNEFGMGKAVALCSGYANKFDGKVSSYPGYEGGSIDLEVCINLCYDSNDFKMQ
uniref:Uncharacterized protein n=1 Tax=Quercus lobata TaxID=97700 RepID=A0A7N2R914_QUELO